MLDTNSIVDKDITLTHDIILFHEKFLEDNESKKMIERFNSIKILATTKIKNNVNCDAILKIPASWNEINEVIEKTSARKIFNKNSSIKIKGYLLDKNQKKLMKDHMFITLTEKEIQLLELFLSNNKPISKNKILSLVWKYSLDADTHTVETHIYRLRKKINVKFSDEKFITNNKDGYFL